MKIASMTQTNPHERIRQNRARIQQNLKLKLKQYEQKDCSNENHSHETVSTFKTQRHVKISAPVGMIQKQYIHGQFQDSYELKEKIGEGAHASVYRCVQKASMKEFAVKITKHGDEELIQSSKVQFKILKDLNHENIMKAEAFYTNRAKLTTYLVCELCDYSELAIYLRNRNRKFLEESQATTIIAQLLQTLQYLHQNGVCHRDIKPENILYNPETKKIKVIDFDCAKIKRQFDPKFEMWTKTGSLFYQAPELFESTIYDEKVDLWAAGVIAYELVTGQPPFKSVYYNSLIKKITGEQIQIENLQVSDEYKVLISKLLEKNPLTRYSASQCLRLPVILRANPVHCVHIFDDFTIDFSSTTCDSPRSSPDSSSIRSSELLGSRKSNRQPLLKYFLFVDQI